MNKLSYVIPTGKNEIAYQAVYAVRSIKRADPQAPVYTFLPDQEVDLIPDDIIHELKDTTNVLTGSIPVPEYPMSVNHAALIEAEKRAETKYIAILDTDILVTKPLELPNEDAELYLKPVDIGNQYWGRSESTREWSELYSRFGVEKPQYGVTATFDQHNVPHPYWNGGVVITDRSIGLGERWKEIASEIYDEINVSHFTDQVSLAIASAEHTICKLTKHHNYPLQARFLCPNDVQVIHYHRFRHLLKAFNHRDFFDEIGITNEIPHGWLSYKSLIFPPIQLKQYIQDRYGIYEY